MSMTPKQQPLCFGACVQLEGLKGNLSFLGCLVGCKTTSTRRYWMHSREHGHSTAQALRQSMPRRQRSMLPLCPGRCTDLSSCPPLPEVKPTQQQAFHLLSEARHQQVNNVPLPCNRCCVLSMLHVGNLKYSVESLPRVSENLQADSAHNLNATQQGILEQELPRPQQRT